MGEKKVKKTAKKKVDNILPEDKPIKVNLSFEQAIKKIVKKKKD